MDQAEHLDHALAEEFAGSAATIRDLKVNDAHFRGLLERNHELWMQIQKIQNGLEPTEDSVLENFEKQRLIVLDEIAAKIAEVERA